MRNGWASAAKVAESLAKTIKNYDPERFSNYGAVRVRLTRSITSSSSDKTMLALDGVRAQVVDAFTCLFQKAQWEESSHHCVLHGNELTMLRNEEDPRFDVSGRLYTDFPPLFVINGDRADEYFTSNRALPIATSVQVLGPVFAALSTNLNLSTPHMEILPSRLNKRLIGDIFSASEDVVRAISNVAEASAKLMTIDGNQLRERGPLLLIAHVGPRTSKTSLGKLLHVHLALEPKDFLRSVLQNPKLNNLRRVKDGTDAFFVLSHAERKRARHLHGGPQNLPEYEFAFRSYLESDIRGARDLINRGLDEQLCIKIRNGWSSSGESFAEKPDVFHSEEGEALPESSSFLILHPSRPRIGISAPLWPASGERRIQTLLNATINLSKSICASVKRSKNTHLPRNYKGEAVQRDHGIAIAIRLGEWKDGSHYQDPFFASLPQEQAVVAFIELEPWVYIGVLNGLETGESGSDFIPGLVFPLFAPSELRTPTMWLEAYECAASESASSNSVFCV